jgi:mono/diheme cytochrome c family protein
MRNAVSVEHPAAKRVEPDQGANAASAQFLSFGRRNAMNLSTGGLIALALLIAACAPSRLASPASAAADIGEGRRLAEVNCATCHAIGVSGESRHPMAPPFRTLSRNYPVNALEEAFAEGIISGHRDMPQFQLEPAQIDDLVAYLNSIQERRDS